MVKLTSLVLLSDQGKDPPKEFRLFRRGLNETSKGSFLFDDAAARSVMADYERHGADLMVDLEHLSLDSESKSYDPDARAWLNLEVRNGELWAVNVRWTPDGAARLAAKKQRYVSPAFSIDDERRITSILNIGLTALPATHKPAALIAANQVRRLSMLSKELLEKAIDALAEGDGDAALAIMRSMVVESATGEEATEEPEADPADSAPESPPDEEAAQLAEDDEEEKEELAALNQIRALTGIKDRAELVAEVKALSARVAEVDARELELEITERKQLAASLVKLGVELPSTAWVGEGKDRKLCDRLASEPLEGLRARVKALSARGPRKVNAPPAGEQVTLSKAELDACKKRNIDPADFAARKAAAVKRTVS